MTVEVTPFPSFSPIEPALKQDIHTKGKAVCFPWFFSPDPNFLYSFGGPPSTPILGLPVLHTNHCVPRAPPLPQQHIGLFIALPLNSFLDVSGSVQNGRPSCLRCNLPVQRRGRLEQSNVSQVVLLPVNCFLCVGRSVPGLPCPRDSLSSSPRSRRERLVKHIAGQVPAGPGRVLRTRRGRKHQGYIFGVTYCQHQLESVFQECKCKAEQGKKL